MSSRELPNAGTDSRTHARLDAKEGQAERFELALIRIAELNGPIECTSLREWREKAQQIARKALSGRK